MRKFFIVTAGLALVVSASGYYAYETQYLPSELRVAATRGELARVQELIRKGVDVNRVLGAPSNSALNRAIEGGNTAVVKVLIDTGADVNSTGESGMTPLMIAAFFGSASIVDLLIRAGARTDVVEPRHNNTALLIAVRRGHAETVSTLLRNRADPNLGAQWGDAPLCRAQAVGRTDIVEALRGAGGTCGGRMSAARP
jgi:uncharacterized protein